MYDCTTIIIFLVWFINILINIVISFGDSLKVASWYWANFSWVFFQLFQNDCVCCIQISLHFFKLNVKRLRQNFFYFRYEHKLFKRKEYTKSNIFLFKVIIVININILFLNVTLLESKATACISVNYTDRPILLVNQTKNWLRTNKIRAPCVVIYPQLRILFGSLSVALLGWIVLFFLIILENRIIHSVK